MSKKMRPSSVAFTLARAIDIVWARGWQFGGTTTGAKQGKGAPVCLTEAISLAYEPNKGALNRAPESCMQPIVDIVKTLKWWKRARSVDKVCDGDTNTVILQAWNDDFKRKRQHIVDILGDAIEDLKSKNNQSSKKKGNEEHGDQR